MASASADYDTATLKHKYIRPIFDKIKQNKDISSAVLKIGRQIILQDIKNFIGQKQVTIGALQFSPAWIINEAINTELSEIWKYFAP